jgi:hypothetical protein
LCGVFWVGRVGRWWVSRGRAFLGEGRGFVLWCALGAAGWTVVGLSGAGVLGVERGLIVWCVLGGAGWTAAGLSGAGFPGEGAGWTVMGLPGWASWDGLPGGGARVGCVVCVVWGGLDGGGSCLAARCFGQAVGPGPRQRGLDRAERGGLGEPRRANPGFLVRIPCWSGVARSVAGRSPGFSALFLWTAGSRSGRIRACVARSGISRPVVPGSAWS